MMIDPPLLARSRVQSAIKTNTEYGRHRRRGGRAKTDRRLPQIEILESREVLNASITSVTNLVTNAATGSLAGSGSTQSIEILGSGFTGTTSVLFGGAGATSFNVVSDTKITANFPAHSVGTVQVQVNVPSGLSNQIPFDYKAPIVTGVSPNSGPVSGGTSVTLTGQYFTGASSVLFGTLGPAGSPGFNIVSDTKITTTSPVAPQAETVDMRVTVNGTQSAVTPNDQFSFVSPPSVTGLTPSKGPNAGGTSVVITGSGFTNATAVNFGSTVITSFQVNQAGTQITVTSPAGNGTVDVTVTTPNGTSPLVAADQFRYTTMALYLNVPSDVASNGVYLTSYGKLDEAYTNTFGISIAAGTNVFLANTGTGYDYVPLSDLGPNVPIPAFLSTTSSLANFPIQIPNVQIEANRVVINAGATTVVSAASNGAVLPQSAINVVSTAGFANSGTLEIAASNGATTSVSYAGATPTSFTPASGGSGTLSTGGVVRGQARLTTVSGNQTISTLGGTLNVASTAAFPAAGWLTLSANSGDIQVRYTAKTDTTFTISPVAQAIQLYSGNTVSGAIQTTASGNQTIPSAGGLLTVASTAGFPTSGTLTLATAGGDVRLTYQSKTSTYFVILAMSQSVTVGSGDTVSGGTLSPPETNNGGGVAAPTPGSEGYNIYDFFEFSYLADPSTNVLKMTINTSAIDQFGLPMTLQVTGSSVAPINQVGILLTRQQIIGVPGATDPGLFSQFVAGTPFIELTRNAEGGPSTTRIISPADQLTINTVQNVLASETAGSGLTAGTYYYAVTALSGTTESTVSQLAQIVLSGNSNVGLVWSASKNQATTSYNVYRGTVSGQSISWARIANVAGAQATDTGTAGTPVSGIPIDPLSTYFNQAITNLFTAYTALNPLRVTVTDGSDPANGLQYNFEGVVGDEPGWVTTATGPSTTPRKVLIFTCTSISNDPPGVTPLIPIGSQFFVYQPFFNTNTTDLNNPSPPSWNGSPYLPYNSIPSAQVFAANGVFADNVPQSQALYNNPNQPPGLDQNAYSVALGAIENKIDAALLRGIATSINPVNWANAPTNLAVQAGTGGSLDNSTTYYYVVTALNSQGESTVSNQVALMPTNGSASLSWTSVDGATGYNIYRGTSAGVENQLIGSTTGQASTSFNDTLLTYSLPSAQPPASGSMTVPVVTQAGLSAGGTLTAGQTYYYKVTAIGVPGESAGSNEMTVTTTQGQQSVSLTWNTIANAAAYKVYRGTSAGGENVLVGTIPGSGTGASLKFTDSGGTDQNLPPNMYYATGSTSDLYAEFFHQTNVSIGGLAYADPFDDQGNQSSTLVAVSPQSVTVTLGHWNTIVTPSQTQVQQGQVLVINGYGFDLDPTKNVVTLSSGVGSVVGVNSTGTQLTYAFTTPPDLGALTATVTTGFGGDSGTAVQVANVTMSSDLPVVQILSGPAPSTASTDAVFSFTASDTGTSPSQMQYSVSIDGGPFVPVSSTKVLYSGLGVGGHVFQVEATDLNGVTSDPAGYVWTVTTVAKIEIQSGTNQTTTVGTQFPSPIILRVVDQGGNPVSDAPITFQLTPSANGASATIVDAVSDRSGNVVVYATANTTPGTYTGKAVSGAVSSATFTLNNANLPIYAVGAAPKAPPRVMVYRNDGSLLASFLAYSPSFKGGVRVIVADMNNDGVDDVIVVPARGGRSLVEIIDGTKLTMTQRNGQISPQAILSSFYAYSGNFNGVVSISTTQFNGDGFPDVVTSAGSNRRRLTNVIDGYKLIHGGYKFPIATKKLPILASFSGYAPRFTARMKAIRS